MIEIVYINNKIGKKKVTPKSRILMYISIDKKKY